MNKKSSEHLRSALAAERDCAYGQSILEYWSAIGHLNGDAEPQLASDVVLHFTAFLLQFDHGPFPAADASFRDMRIDLNTLVSASAGAAFGYLDILERWIGRSGEIAAWRDVAYLSPLATVLPEPAITSYDSDAHQHLMPFADNAHAKSVLMARGRIPWDEHFMTVFAQSLEVMDVARGFVFIEHLAQLACRTFDLATPPPIFQARRSRRSETGGQA